MLDSLYIKNFRIFKELHIKYLGRINLIVGKNNSGKTSLLEALLSYATNASPYWLDSLIFKRSEHWEIETKDYKKLQSNNNPLRHMFYDHKFPISENDCIEIGSLNDHNDRIYLRTRNYEILELQESRNTKPLALWNLSSLENWNQHLNVPKPKMEVEWVSTNSYHNNERIAELWDNINLTDLKESVLTALKIIEPSIQDLGLTIGNNENRFVIIRLKDSKEIVSLDSLGEGMSRLFYIMLSLVNSKNGFLLIDEFENGLHYTVQTKVWKLIFKMANDLNVQVFATTHSLDCVTAFQKTAQESDENAMLFRLGTSILKSDNKKVIAIEYNKDKLQLVTEAELEVRG